MSNLLAPILTNLDTKLVIIIAVAMLILFIITIGVFKKITKMAIFLIAICVMLTTIIPFAKSFQDKYSFRIDGKEAVITTNGQEYKLGELKNIKDAVMVYNGRQGVDITIHYNNESMTFEVPVFLNNTIKDYFDTYNIKYTVRE